MVDTGVFFIITQIELIIVIAILIYIVMLEHKRKHHKPDALLKHFKEYIAEGYTFGQAKEKLEKLGFDKERIEKIILEFKQH